jgi:methionine biosynthesis protein MetW
MLESFLVAFKSQSNYLNWGRAIIRRWSLEAAQDKSELRVLDVGCGDGDDIVNFKNDLAEKNIAVSYYGLDMLESHRSAAEAKGIKLSLINLETDVFPYENNFFDLIIINQVLEHLKEFFFIASEMNRVLKPGGRLIIGVPNLASWHNRLLLLFGRQPTSIRLLGPHVRAYTKESLEKTLSQYGGFTLERFAGSNFYPWPAPLAKLLARIFPNSAVSIFLAFKKTGPASFEKFLATGLETNFKTPA